MRKTLASGLVAVLLSFATMPVISADNTIVAPDFEDIDICRDSVATGKGYLHLPVAAVNSPFQVARYPRPYDGCYTTPSGAWVCCHPCEEGSCCDVML